MEQPDNIRRLREIVSNCTLCPRNCRVERAAGELGACRIAGRAAVASFGPHFGEESTLVGSGGSGTVFFSGCNLGCVFCQNCDISQSSGGRQMSAGEIADIMLELASSGCVNINLVSPTHVAHAAAEAIWLARGRGLAEPVVYNSGGYDAVSTLRLLEGLVEIYMPDFKWADALAGAKYSQAADYPAVAAAALGEMYRQVGVLRTDSAGLATRGLLVRHLVMPHDLAGSHEVIDIVAAVAPGCAINVMGQYHPAHRAGQFPELLANPSPTDVAELRRYASSCGLVRADH